MISNDLGVAAILSRRRRRSLCYFRQFDDEHESEDEDKKGWLELLDQSRTRRRRRFSFFRCHEFPRHAHAHAHHLQLIGLKFAEVSQLFR